MRKDLVRIRQAWMSDPALVYTRSSSAPQIALSDHNSMMIQVTSEHPLVSKYTNLLAAQTGMTTSQHINLRWFFHYVFHPPALACFLIGFFSLSSVEIQLLGHECSRCQCFGLFEYYHQFNQSEHVQPIINLRQQYQCRS